MYSLKENDIATWKYFEEEKFVVNKHASPFSAICLKYRIEQKNRAMKVLSGVTGLLTQKQLCIVLIYQFQITNSHKP